MKFFKAVVCSMILFLGYQDGYSQNCTLTCPDNIIMKTDEGKEGAVVNFPQMNAPEGCGTLTYTPASGSFFRLGSHSVIISSSTGTKCSFTVTVTDNEPPTVSPLTLSRAILWPASNKMKKLRIYYDAADNAQNVKTKLTVSSNSSEGGDVEIVDEHLVRLKASRLADGSPRTYTITVVATDDAGNKTTRTTTISVSQTMTAVPGLMQ